MAEQDDRQALIDRLNANASALLDGKEVERLELVNAMVAASSMLGYSRSFVAPEDGGVAG